MSEGSPHQRTPTRATVVYFESRLLSSNGPQVCSRCEELTETWRNRWDNLAAVLRGLGQQGTGFRPDVERLIVLCPRGYIESSVNKCVHWLIGRSRS